MRSRKTLASDELFRGCQKYHEVNETWKKGMKGNPLMKYFKMVSVPLIEMAQYTTTSERLGSGDYDVDFMELVR